MVGACRIGGNGVSLMGWNLHEVFFCAVNNIWGPSERAYSHGMCCCMSSRIIRGLFPIIDQNDDFINNVISIQGWKITFGCKSFDRLSVALQGSIKYSFYCL